MAELTETDDVDRIWRESLTHLAAAGAAPPEPAAAVARRVHRNRVRARARGAGAAIAIPALVVTGLGLGSLRHESPRRVAAGGGGDAVPTSVPAAPPVGVPVLDAPGGNLSIRLPGRVVGAGRDAALPAGAVRFEITMPSAGHELVLDGVPDFAPVSGAGTFVRTVQLAPGRYRLYCTVPGHAAAGEQVFLDVR